MAGLENAPAHRADGGRRRRRRRYRRALRAAAEPRDPDRVRAIPRGGGLGHARRRSRARGPLSGLFWPQALTMRGFRVGLTGGIASGKSTVARLFAALGVPIIDT